MRSVKLLFTGSMLLMLLISACTGNKTASPLQTAKIGSRYTCPMHPQIMEDHAGNCPICGMSLVKKSGQASESSGVSLNTVLQPVNSSVISKVRAIVPQQREVASQIDGQGYLDFDTRTFNNISARFSGRIEKLYIKYAFQMIEKGQRIFDIYSPEMVTAQQDLIYLKAHSPLESGLIHAATQKLLLLGMTSAQVAQLTKTGKVFYSLPVYSPYNGHVHDRPHNQMPGATETKDVSALNVDVPLSIKEGMYVEKGQQLFNVVDPHYLWAVIKVDLADMAALKINQPVVITVPDQPNIKIRARVDFIEPALQEGDKSSTVRVYISNTEHALRVNSLVKATIQIGVISGLWIPRSAVVNLGQETIVWLRKGNLYKAHRVVTGITDNSEVQITKGLSATDSIAENAHYFSDSESFIKTDDNDK